MARIDGWLREAEIGRFVRYGHVGNGHPHYNLIVEDAAEAARASAVVDRMCAEACALGGPVSAEHWLAKVKLPYIHHRFGAFELAVMRAVKAAFDPRGLLNPGKAVPTLARCAEFNAIHVHDGRIPFPDIDRF